MKQVCLDANKYFALLRRFDLQSCTDKRLSTLDRLVYRVLLEKANAIRTTADDGGQDQTNQVLLFEVSDSELMKIANIKSSDTMTNAKRQLKNCGYIDFESHKGKPTKYMLVDTTVENQSVNEPVYCTVQPVKEMPSPSSPHPNHLSQRKKYSQSQSPRVRVKNENTYTNEKPQWLKDWLEGK